MNANITESDFVNFDEAESLIDSFNNLLSSYSIKNTYALEFEKNIQSEILKSATDDHLGWLLIIEQHEIFEIIRVDINAVNYFKALIDLDGNSFRLMSLDKTRFIMIDLFEEQHSEWVYEVSHNLILP